MALIAVRVVLVERSIGTYIACPGCFHTAVIGADGPMISALASLLLLASSLRPDGLSRLLHLLAGVLLLIYAADLVVFGLFTSRLLMQDVALFLGEGSAVWDQFISGVGGWAAGLAILTGVVALFVLLAWMRPLRSRAFRLALSALLALGLIVSALMQGADYVNDWAVENVFAANMSTPSRNHFSAEKAAEVLARAQEQIEWRQQGTPPANGRNVILILVESWSGWHSRLFGGFEDWTPHLDEGARRGLRFENFHCIGFSTDKGLVGILAGQHLWSPFLHWFETPPFHSMWGVERTLPAVFNAHSYHTAFLTSGPLSLYRKGEWLADLGFAEVEGNEHPFYQGWPRFSFGSAPDRALYQRALQWMAGQEDGSPWLLVLETVSTHQPYKDPDSGERSLELAMKYADREFGAFLDRLEGSGFFDDGMLAVVSDHRSMTPMWAEEFERWGPAAYSRVPAFVIGDGFEPGASDGAVYSQGDLTTSFEWWLSGRTLLRPSDAVMFDPRFERPKCAFYERSDRRGMVMAICEEGHGEILLDGDHTRFLDARTEGISPARQQQLLGILARHRLEAWQRHLATE